MDVVDLNKTNCGRVYTSCMFIPEEHQGAPPTPRDARVSLEDFPLPILLPIKKYILKLLMLRNVQCAKVLGMHYVDFA